MTIGEKIKEYRKLNSLSQTDLASLIGVDVSFLCKVEKNEKKVSFDKLKLIIKVLEIQENDLKNQYFIDRIDELLSINNPSSKIEILNQLIKKYKDEE